MRKNLVRDVHIAENFFGFGAVSRKMALTRAEEREIINGGWLHQVTASDFEQARQQLTGEPEKPPQAAVCESKPEVDVTSQPTQGTAET